MRIRTSRKTLAFQNGSGAIKGKAVIAISLRCPECRQVGTFAGLPDCPDIVFVDQETKWGKRRVIAGSRVCPNEDCLAHVFIVHDKGKLLEALPPEQIEFDPKNVPSRVLSTLEQAITCHAAECYSAAAMMIRKAMEEICEERGAKGKTLEDRIKALGTSIVIPDELVTAMHDIRYLGNDAAHVIAKTYDDVGKNEVEAAIDVAKLIVQACYQYVAIIDKLKSLKRQSP